MHVNNPDTQDLRPPPLHSEHRPDSTASQRGVIEAKQRAAARAMVAQKKRDLDVVHGLKR